MDLKLPVFQEFPGEPLVRLHGLIAKSTGSTSDQGTKIPLASRCSQILKKKKSTLPITRLLFFIYNLHLPVIKMIKVPAENY